MHDLGEKGVRADALGAHDEAAGAVDGAAGDLGRDIFLDRDGFAADHGLIDGAVAFEDDAIDGNFLAGSDAEPVADLDLIERHVGFAALVVKPRAVFGAKPSSARMALPVWLRARSSITWPRRTSAMMTAAGS